MIPLRLGDPALFHCLERCLTLRHLGLIRSDSSDQLSWLRIQGRLLLRFVCYLSSVIPPNPSDSSFVLSNRPSKPPPDNLNPDTNRRYRQHTNRDPSEVDNHHDDANYDADSRTAGRQRWRRREEEDLFEQ